MNYKTKPTLSQFYRELATSGADADYIKATVTRLARLRFDGYRRHRKPLRLACDKMAQTLGVPNRPAKSRTDTSTGGTL